MNSLLIIFLSLFIFSINTRAAEIIMVCTNKNEGERILRYKSTLGIKKITIRREDGTWENWGDSDDYISSNLKINDKGAILKTVYQTTLVNSNEKAGVSNTEKILSHAKYYLDFQFFKRKVYSYFTYKDYSTIKKGMRGFDPNIPWETIWTCEEFNKLSSK